MGKIICFMGKSSTGKDTIFQKLMEDRELHLHTLVPYTTRPIRDGEENGVQYIFTDEEGYQKLLKAGKIIEERTYDTYYGLWRYFTVDDGRIDLENNSYGVIGTLEAFNRMRDFFGKDIVIPIPIGVDDGDRLPRALDREKAQDNPKYEEMCRRYIADSNDFAQQKIKDSGIEKVFFNKNLESCFVEIKDYIKELI